MSYSDFVKVNKPRARKLFNSGVPVYLLASKVNAYCAFDKELCGFITPCRVEYKEDGGENQFDRTVMYFEAYNCNSELGYYAHYFINKEDLKNEAESKESGTERRVAC